MTLRPAAVGYTPELVPVRMTVGVTRAVNRERTMASENLFVPSLEQMSEDCVTADWCLTTLYWINHKEIDVFQF